MTPRFLARRSTAVAATAGALTAGLGVAGVVGALTVQPHPASRAAALAALPSAPRTGSSPYFVCLAYKQVWGICIGPPTN